MIIHTNRAFTIVKSFNQFALLSCDAFFPLESKNYLLTCSGKAIMSETSARSLCSSNFSISNVFPSLLNARAKSSAINSFNEVNVLERRTNYPDLISFS